MAPSNDAVTGATVRRVAAVSSDTGWGTYAVIGVLLFGAYKCSQSDHAPSEAVAARTHDEDAARERAEEAARDAVSGTTYEEQGRPYGCTDDCSGHDAGYRWAEENDVTDASDCSGNSQSFVAGCEAYAEAYEEAKQEALDNEEE
jgi:hypothetical protein